MRERVPEAGGRMSGRKQMNERREQKYLAGQSGGRV